MPSSQYPICETFHSVQSEGLLAGQAAFFIRFSGCNLSCEFDNGFKCDEPLHTDKSKIEMLSLLDLEIRARKITETLNVVITGGEPSMSGGIGKMIRMLKSFGFYVSVETNGYKMERLIDADLITYSPKLKYSAGARMIAWEEFSSWDTNGEIELKLLANENNPVDTGRWDSYPIKFVQAINHSDSIDIENARWVSEWVAKNPDWRVSFQTHKVVKVD